MAETTRDQTTDGAAVTERGPVLEARGIEKNYGRVQALRGANFTACAGEVTALIGDNGAGKSTLTKILSGVVAPDAGELRFVLTRANLSSMSQFIYKSSC